MFLLIPSIFQVMAVKDVEEVDVEESGTDEASSMKDELSEHPCLKEVNSRGHLE